MILTKTTYPIRKYPIENLETFLRPTILYLKNFSVFFMVCPENGTFNLLKNVFDG